MDLAARRREFPALDVRPQARPDARLAYLDSAATTLVPRTVIDKVSWALTNSGNPGRGVYELAQVAADQIEDARLVVAAAISKPRPSGVHSVSDNEIVFTSGTTASINLVADTWGAQHVGANDVVIATELEHHANFLPWQRLCERRGAQFVVAPIDDRGHIDLDALRVLVSEHGERIKLVAVAHVSNVFGTIAPIADITKLAHSVGARVLVDGAQAIAHLPVDVSRNGCDFYVFSGHKVYGPPGVGVLWVRPELLAQMPPWQVGGAMVAHVTKTASTWRDGFARFEAGTPNTAAIVGLHAALEEVPRAATSDAVRADEAAVHAALCETIRGAGARILGAPEIGVVSFAWDYHPHDIATIADGEGVALRSGHHCAQLAHRRFGVDASTRASVGCYSGLDDVEQLGRALAKVRQVLGSR